MQSWNLNSRLQNIKILKMFKKAFTEQYNYLFFSMLRQSYLMYLFCISNKTFFLKLSPYPDSIN